MWTDEEVKRAEEEDRIVERALGEALNRPPQQMYTPESIAAGDATMAEGSVKAAETLARRVESKELLSADALRSALRVTQQAIDEAVASHRLFAFEGPGGQHYYPAFYADGIVNKAALEMVAQELRELPAPSKYHFFVSMRANLGATTLEALQCGRLAEVLRAAIGFAIT